MAEYDEEFKNLNPEFREQFRHSDIYPQASIINRPTPQPSWMQHVAKATNPVNFITNTLPKAVAESSIPLGHELSQYKNDPQYLKDRVLDRIANLLGQPVNLLGLGANILGTGDTDVRLHAKGNKQPKEPRYFPNGATTTSLPSEPLYGSSEHLRNLLKAYGIHSGSEDDSMIGHAADWLLPSAVTKAPRAINAAGAAARRPFTPVTATLEGVAPDLGQVSSEGWKRGITDRLLGGKDAAIDISNFAGQPTTSQMGFGAWKKERNPLLAVDVPNIRNISAHPEFNRTMNQIGADLNQEGMAAHRFLPHLINTMGDASAAFIKPKSGNLTPEQFTKLHELLGDSMAFTHNPRMGGVVVYPFGEVTGGKTPEELQQALSAANKVLGREASVKFGKADYNKDRFYKTAQEYGATPNPEVTRIRNLLKGLENQAILPKEGAGNVGGIQSWSRGRELPTHVRAEGNLNPVRWRPVNFETGQQGQLYDRYHDADAAREAMREQWLSTLPARVR